MNHFIVTKDEGASSLGCHGIWCLDEEVYYKNCLISDGANVILLAGWLVGGMTVKCVDTVQWFWKNSIKYSDSNLW